MKKTIKTMMILAAAGIMVMITMALTGCGTKTIDLNKYISVEFDGYDGYGNATVVFDDEAFMKDNAGSVKYYSADKEELQMINNLRGVVKEQFFVAQLRECIGFRLDSSNTLHNGDVVTIKWNCNDEKADNSFHVKFNYSDMPFVVNGLDEVKEFDPFEDIKISVSGFSPDGSLNIVPGKYSTLNYMASKSSGLSNGETIVISIDSSFDFETMIARYGAIPSKTEMTYTVEGLGHYVNDIDEIPKDLYNKMDKQMLDEFYATAERNWEHGVEDINSINNVGNYMVTLKEGVTRNPHNYLYYVYKVNIDTEDGEFTYYWYGYFTDIMILEDGTCTVDISGYTVSESSSFFGLTDGDYLKCDANHYVAGFKEIDSLFNKQIVSKSDLYEYKSTITE
ncbi:MAG: hypothetical protein E7233_04465 [Lachnospiraceae bacterium]|nr:hypothetical protein [Lachnospiraceae bacterium]